MLCLNISKSVSSCTVGLNWPGIFWQTASSSSSSLTPNQGLAQWYTLLERLWSIPLPRTRAASPIPPTSGKSLYLLYFSPRVNFLLPFDQSGKLKTKLFLQDLISQPLHLNAAALLLFIVIIDLNTLQLKLSFLLEGKVTIIQKILKKMLCFRTCLLNR